MSKSKTGQKALEVLSALLNKIQDRTIWLSDEFRGLANGLKTLQERVRLNRGEYQEFVEKADAAVLELQRAHNRLRFEFDKTTLGPYTACTKADVTQLRVEFETSTKNLIAAIAAVNKNVHDVGDVHNTLRIDHDKAEVRNQGAVTVLTSEVDKLRKLFETQQAEIDRLRTLSASRADLAVQKYNELYERVNVALQKFNERVSKLETVDVEYVTGMFRHNKILIEGLQERVRKLEGFHKSFVEVARFWTAPDTLHIQQGEPGDNAKSWSPNVCSPSTNASRDPITTSCAPPTRGVSHS